jgi:AraC family transcriptional regulator
MLFDPHSSTWSDVSVGERRPLSQSHWPGVKFSWTVENISQQTIWSIKRENHTVIVHLGGPIRKIETELNGKGLSPGLPLAGDIWIIPAGHSYQSEALGGTIRYAELEFDQTILSALTERNVDVGPITYQIGQSDLFLHRSAVRLAQLTQHVDDLSALTSASLGHTLLLHFFTAYPRKQNMVRRLSPRNLFSAYQRKLLKEFIADNLHRPILLAQLASLVQMTSHELLEAFRYAFGTTPAQYIIDRRLRRARAKLLASNKTIATLAVELGFSSHAHLTSTFSARFGMTPSQFRASKSAGQVLRTSHLRSQT